MKSLEQDPRLPTWLNALFNRWPLCIDPATVSTLFTLAWDAQGLYVPEERSLFYNGYVFFRVTFPFGLWLHLKWKKESRFQCGLGWKLNGRLAVTFRYQSDAAAARGVLGPNYGQAGAWDRGTA